MRNLVVIDTASGQALIGSTRVPVREAGKHGELQVDCPYGPVVRPLTFGERTRLVTRAAVAPAALDSLCAGVLQAAIVEPGQADRSVQEILALTLAGADQEAPSFAETALRVARAAGWELSQLYEAEAAAVDRLAMYLGGRPQDSGWTRIVFSRSEDTPESIRQKLGERLLQRADPFAEAMGGTGQAAGRVAAERAHPSDGQVAERLFSLGQMAASGQAVRHPAMSAPFPPPGTPAARSSAPKPGYMRIRIPTVTSERSAGIRSTPAMSARGSSTELPSIRWSAFPSRSSHGMAASAAPASPARALAESAAVATTTVVPRALQPEPLPFSRVRPDEWLDAAPTTAAMLSIQRLMGAPAVSPADVHGVAGIQSTTHALDTPGQLELPAALHCIRPLHIDYSEVAEALAELLDQEADMRGIER